MKMKQKILLDKENIFVAVKNWIGFSKEGYYHIPLLYFAFGKKPKSVSASITILGFNVTFRIGKRPVE